MKKISTLITIMIVIISCEDRSDNFQSEETSYSGQEIFTGLFFAQGPVASIIPEIGNNFDINNLNLSTDQLVEIVTFQNELLEFIEPVVHY